MEESTTYQMILRKGEQRGEERGELRGRVKAARNVLLLQGNKKFGQADAAVQERLAGVTNPQILEHLLERLLDVSSWDELLAGIPAESPQKPVNEKCDG